MCEWRKQYTSQVTIDPYTIANYTHMLAKRVVHTFTTNPHTPLEPTAHEQ